MREEQAYVNDEDYCDDRETLCRRPSLHTKKALVLAEPNRRDLVIGCAFRYLAGLEHPVVREPVVGLVVFGGVCRKGELWLCNPNHVVQAYCQCNDEADDCYEANCERVEFEE